MNAIELGNTPVDKLTYRQAIVLALLPASIRGCHSRSEMEYAWEYCNSIAGEILAREAQENN